MKYYQTYITSKTIGIVSEAVYHTVTECCSFADIAHLQTHNVIENIQAPITSTLIWDVYKRQERESSWYFVHLKILFVKIYFIWKII